MSYFPSKIILFSSSDVFEILLITNENQTSYFSQRDYNCIHFTSRRQELNL